MALNYNYQNMNNFSFSYSVPPQYPHFGEWNVPQQNLGGSSQINMNHMNSGQILTEAQQKWVHLCYQRSIDQTVLNQFVESHLANKINPSTNSTKISEFKELATEAVNLLTQLEQICSKPSKDWSNDDLNLSQTKRERLGFVMEQINDSSKLKAIQEKITTRRNKRKWLERRKQRWMKEQDEAVLKRQRLNDQIDQEREILRAKILTEKRDRETQQEADLILSDVRRKQHEAKQLVQLIDSLKELRELRANSVKSQHALYATEKDNRHFTEVTTKMKTLVNNQLEIYSKEEATLRAMISKDNCPQDVRKQWNKFLEK